MKWITREKVDVDRVACSWLIKRFIDPDGEFSFLPPTTDWSALKEANVFDAPGQELSHEGDRSAFDALLAKCEIRDAELMLMSDIVRSADECANPHPAAQGLRWIGSGLSELNLADHELLETTFIICDALYAQSKRIEPNGVKTAEFYRRDDVFRQCRTNFLTLSE